MGGIRLKQLRPSTAKGRVPVTGAAPYLWAASPLPTTAPSPVSTFVFAGDSASAPVAVIQAVASQTANIVEVQESTGSLFLGVSGDGAEVFGGIATGSAPALSGSGNARIYYNSTDDKLYLSKNGAAYVELATGGAVGAHSFLSATHTDTLAGGVVRGDVIVGNSTPRWSRLAVGAASTFLKSDGTDVSWGSVSLGSDISGVLPIANGGTNSSSALNNDRIMVSSGGAIVEAGALSDGELLIGSTGAAPVAAAISGTANQVTVVNGAGSITLSTPQDIHTGATPQFARLGIGVAADGSNLLHVGSGDEFRVDSSGDLIRINDVPYSWPVAQGALGSILVNNGSGSLTWTTISSLTEWSDLQDPSTNLSLNMAAYTTVFTWDNNTGANNLFTLTDTASNSGTGYILSVETASGSAAKPFQIVADGTTRMTVEPVSGSASDTQLIHQTGNGASLSLKTISELVTIAAAVTTDSTLDLLPANAWVVSVEYRVVTAIPTATTFDVGTSSTADLFGDNISTTLNTVSTSFQKSPPLGPFMNSSASKVRITPDAVPGSATGQVRVSVHYFDVTAPTS